MKRIWASVILIAVVIALCAADNVYINNTCDKSLQYLEELEAQYGAKEYDNAVLTATELENHWVDSEKLLTRFVSTEMLNDIGANFAKLTVLAKNKNDEFLPELRESQVMICHFLKSERYTIY